MNDNIYLIQVYGKEEESLIKIGYSSNIEKRLKDYYYHNPLYQLLLTCYVKDGKKFEKYIHKKYVSKVLSEWYSPSILDVLMEEIKQYQLKTTSI